MSRYFSVIISGTNLTKLETIKSWIIEHLDNNDLEKNYNISILESPNNLGNYTLTLDIFIKPNIHIDKYKDIIVNQFTSLNKTGLTYAKVIQYDNCTHDSGIHTECQPSTRMEWN